jgi:hypothetical protein
MLVRAAIALCGGAAGVAALRAMPFLTKLSILEQHEPSKGAWAAFVIWAFVLGAASGATVFLPRKALRVPVLLALIAFSGVLLFGVAALQTLDSMHSGDSLIALIMLSPIAFFFFVLYLGCVAATLVAIAVGGGLVVAPLEATPVNGQKILLALAAAVALLLVSPSLWVYATEPAPEDTIAATQPTQPRAKLEHCGDPPFFDVVRQTAGVHAFSMTTDRAASEVRFVIVPSRDQAGAPVIDALLAASGKGQCADPHTPKLWHAVYRIAEQRRFVLHLHARPQKGSTNRDLEAAIASNARSIFDSSLEAREDGTFGGSLAEVSGLYPTLDRAIRCEPADDLHCELDTLATTKAGLVPVIGEVRVIVR